MNDLIPVPRPPRLRLSELEALRKNAFLFLLLGAGLIMLGIFALGYTAIATKVSVVVFGWLLTVGGAGQAVHAFWARRWLGFVVQLLTGVTQAVAGVLIISWPETAEKVLTLLIGAFFLAGGALRLGVAVASRFEFRGWLVVGGLVSLLMGGIILAEWPFSGEWVIGLFVGVELLIHGAWLVALAVTVYELPMRAWKRRGSPPV